MLITPLQASRIRCLAGASMLPGSTEKKFVQEMAGKLKLGFFEKKRLTPGQHLWLAKMAWKYRRQLPGEITPRQEPRTMMDERMKLEFYGEGE